MIVENMDAFKVWLSKTLDPICDADPGTLSRYVLALIKKDKAEAELKDTCIEQLDVFLQSKTKGFVDTLFCALKSKSYLNVEPVVNPPAVVPVKTTPPVANTPIVTPPPEVEKKKADKPVKIPEDNLRETKRRRSRSPQSPKPRGRDLRDDRRRRYDRSRYSPDRRYGRRRSRTPSPIRRDRRSPDRSRGRSRDRSRSPRSRSRSWSRNRSRSRSRSRGRQTDSRGSTPTLDNGRYSTASAIPTIQSVSSSVNHVDTPGESTPLVLPGGPRPRCRDYDEKGFCMRGDLCPFDHGLDPVVVDDIPNMSIPPPNLNGPPPNAPPITGPRPRLPLAVGSRPPPPPVRPGGPQLTPPRPAGLPSHPPPPPGICPPRMRPPPPRPPGPPPPPPPVEQGYNPEAPALTSRPPPGYWGNHSNPAPRPPAPPFFNANRRDLVHVRTLPDGPPQEMEQDEVELPSPPEPIVQSRVVVPNKHTYATMEEKNTPFYGGRGAGDGGRGAGGRGRGQGSGSPMKRFDYARLGGYRRQYNNDNSTLEVRKVPRESNNIAKLNEHFGKFGTLVNVQVCFGGDAEAALVTFSNNGEAQAAYKSSEPVFNNRFIKVFWHRKDEEKTPARPAEPVDPEVLKAQYKEIHEQQQQENLKQKVLVTFNTTPEILPSPDQLRIPARARLGVAPVNKTRLSGLIIKTAPESPTEKGIVYTSSVGNIRKTVFNTDTLKQTKMSYLTSPTAVKTADFVTRIEAIKKGEELKKEAVKKGLEIAHQKQQLLKKQIDHQKKLIAKLESNKNMNPEDKNILMKTLKTLTGSIDVLKTEVVPLGSVKSPEQARKEILDTELELMTKSGHGEDTSQLKKKLMELTHQASSMGLIGGRGRGRGRGSRGHAVIGRGAWMGRGRGRGASLSLDKRPKTLQIRGFELEEKEELKAFFGETCLMESVVYNDSIPSAIITFASRKDAEKAIGKSGKYKKPLRIQWHVPLKRTVSVVSDDSLTGTFDDDMSHLEEVLDEAVVEDEEDDDEESRSWRR